MSTSPTDRAAVGHLSLLWDGLISLVYPHRCAVCLELGRPVVCPRCLAGFVEVEAPMCRRCGREIDDTEPHRGDGAWCGQCRDQDERHFVWARARGRFDGALRTAIHRLKYDGRRPVADVLGQWMRAPVSPERRGLAGPALRLPHTPDIVVPVPLHWTRMRERGFNQSLLIARAFVGERGWPVEPDGLKRTRRTRPQVELDADERAANVRDAFAVADAEMVRGSRVLLVDDVITTLSTVDECARMLMGAGATEVYVAAVAR